jgi:hypothetical protein
MSLSISLVPIYCSLLVFSDTTLTIISIHNTHLTYCNTGTITVADEDGGSDDGEHSSSKDGERDARFEFEEPAAGQGLATLQVLVRAGARLNAPTISPVSYHKGSSSTSSSSSSEPSGALYLLYFSRAVWAEQYVFCYTIVLPFSYQSIAACLHSLTRHDI